MMQDCHNILNILSIGEYFMNFLNFITSGASLLNFNLQNITSGFGFNSPQLHPADQKTDSKEGNAKTVPIHPTTESTEEGRNSSGKETEVELFTKQQQLINQYMHLNIQLLSKKLQSLENVEKQPKNDDQEHQNEPRSAKKKIKKTNTCGHADRQHYAKGMCSNCYHKFGRNKKPWNCQHDKLYANGMCQNCYINSYNRKRREERAEERNEGSEAALKIEEEE